MKGAGGRMVYLVVTYIVGWRESSLVGQSVPDTEIKVATCSEYSTGIRLGQCT